MNTPWASMLQAAVRMGVPPEAFWRLSVKEWRMLTTAAAADAPMGRATFARLSARWPDIPPSVGEVARRDVAS